MISPTNNANREPIGRSGHYATSASMSRGIASVEKNAGKAAPSNCDA